jgi:GTPase
VRQALFRVAIVGRPNVGKSTLFNRLCGSRRAIVGDEPGITRDRIQGTVQWTGRTIQLLDTGGIVPDSADIIPAKTLEQVQVAMGESDVLLLVVDGRAGITALDEQLLPTLRKARRPVWVVVNKIDTPELEPEAAEFYALGFDKVLAVSAEHGRGIGELLDEIAAGAEGSASSIEPDQLDEIGVAVVGRPNVGKSSLVNRLLGVERCIVSEIPGTTRDSIDTLLLRDGIRYRIVDTAGIRRKGSTDQRTEKVSVVMARKNLARADVALLLIDAVEGVTKLDAAIGGYAYEAACSVVIILNKWDRVQKDEHTLQEYTDSIHRRMKYLSHAPILTVSALTGQRVSKIFDLILKASESRRVRISTGVLNNLFVPDLSEKFSARNPSAKLEIRYITQASSNPPTFVVFTSGTKPLHFSTERYLVNQLREKFGFYAAPIRIQQRLKKRRKRAG